MANFLKHAKIFRKAISCAIAVIFIISIFTPFVPAYAQYLSNLPKPGEMVLLSPHFEPVILKGMTVHPENPLQFNFVVDRGQDMLKEAPLKTETERLLKYFLTAMTIPDQESWVNLSPYEGER